MHYQSLSQDHILPDILTMQREFRQVCVSRIVTAGRTFGRDIVNGLN